MLNQGPPPSLWTLLLGRQIRATREAQRLSPPLLAARAEVELDALLRIEKGSDNVRLADVERLLRALGLEPPLPEMRNWSGLPVHAVHVESESVERALEQATEAASDALDTMFLAKSAKLTGITSTFKKQLKRHLSAMLCGLPGAAQLDSLPVLVYSRADAGGPLPSASPAPGWALVLLGTDDALQDGELVPVPSEKFIPMPSRELAVEGVQQWVERHGHLPGPVEAVPLWMDENGHCEVQR